MEEKELVEFLEGKALQLRRHILEMVGVGKAGHLGGSSSCAEIVAALYFHWMKIDPENQHDPERDRFLLSKGHAALVHMLHWLSWGIFRRRA